MSNSIVDGEKVYCHTQKSPLFVLLILFAGLFFVLTLYADESVARVILPVIGSFFGILALSFFSLTVWVTLDEVFLRFGPFPLFGTSVMLSDIEEATVDRTSVIDGWGIHFVPWRGWTYNLWGFDCVRLKLNNGRCIRVGTDDAENLAAQIAERINSSS